MIMKKYLLYTLFGAASLMASCTEDFNEDVAAPQQWEQEAAITLSKPTAGSASAIDLATATEFDESIKLADFITIVDEASWKEFMPKEVDKNLFRDEFKALFQLFSADVKAMLCQITCFCNLIRNLLTQAFFCY